LCSESSVCKIEERREKKEKGKEKKGLDHPRVQQGRLGRVARADCALFLVLVRFKNGS
jgi:hypothetical protein